ncbi:MAG: hypothetical protein RMK29_14925 [Myxococcales bacterium]|nr:hypothetical protein [Myxococcales bacterium]
MQAQTPRYYIVVRDVEGPPGASSQDAAARLARTVLLEELGRRPEIVLGGLPQDHDALRQELSRRRLRGYQLTLRLLSVSRALNPPPPGKQYRVLERGVRLTVIGTTLPGDQLAVGGDGESTVQADVGAQVGPHKEQELLLEALRDAIGQAVQQAIRKLDKGGMVPPQEKPRKKSGQ